MTRKLAIFDSRADGLRAPPSAAVWFRSAKACSLPDAAAASSASSRCPCPCPCLCPCPLGSPRDSWRDTSGKLSGSRRDPGGIPAASQRDEMAVRVGSRCRLAGRVV